MSWKPVRETWKKRPKRRYGRGLWYAPGRIYRAPVGTPPDSPDWEEIGRTSGFDVVTYGPGALYDSISFVVRNEPSQLVAPSVDLFSQCHIQPCLHKPDANGYCFWHERPHT